MARSLKELDNNKLVIDDSLSNDSVAFYFSLPTASQVVGYQNKVYVTENRKVKIDGNQKINAALEVITGFEDTGYFLDEKGKPFSSNPKADNYREDWKELVKRLAPDLLLAAAQEIFEGARASKEGSKDFLERT